MSPAGLPIGGVRVSMRGSFQMTSSMILGPEDGGTADSPIVWTSAPDTTACIHGSIELPLHLVRPVTDAATLRRLSPRARDRIRCLDLTSLGLVSRDVGDLRSFGFSESVLPTGAELFIDGRAFHLARYPNAHEGFEHVGTVVRQGSVPRKGIVATDGEGFAFTHGPHLQRRIKRWERNQPDGRIDQADDIWLMGYWQFNWAEQTARVLSLDVASGVVTTEHASHYGVREDARYHFYNVLEELDHPLEYYIDRRTMTLYFYPPEDVFESLERARQNPPTMDGTSKKRMRTPSTSESPSLHLSLLSTPLLVLHSTQHLSFDGVTFEHTRGSGVRILDARGGVALRGCTVRRIGNTGIVCGSGATRGGTLRASKSVAASGALLDKAGNPDIEYRPDDPAISPPPLGDEEDVVYGHIGASLFSRNFVDTMWDRKCGRGVSLHGNTISQTGAGGIVVGGGSRVDLASAGNSVVANRIHHFSRTWLTYRPAVWVDGVGVVVARNHLHSAPHAAIILAGNEHIVELNDISHVCAETRDVGAIYMGRDWTQRGHTIRFNYVHHITGVVPSISYHSTGGAHADEDDPDEEEADPMILAVTAAPDAPSASQLVHLRGLLRRNPSNELDSGMSSTLSQANVSSANGAASLVDELSYHVHVGHDSNAIYLDDMASGVDIFGNVVVSVERGVLVGGGRDNRLMHNIFMDTAMAALVDQRGAVRMSYHASPEGVLQRRLRAAPYQSAVWAARYPALQTLLAEDPGLPRNNTVMRNLLLHSGNIDCQMAAKSARCRSTAVRQMPSPVLAVGRQLVGGLESLVQVQGSNVLLHRAHDAYDGIDSLPVTPTDEWIQPTPPSTDLDQSVSRQLPSSDELVAAAKPPHHQLPIRLDHAALQRAQGAAYLPIPIELIGPCSVD